MMILKSLISLLTVKSMVTAFCPYASSARSSALHSNNGDFLEESSSRRDVLTSMLASSAVILGTPLSASARLEAVNRPDLLPSEPGTHVIQTEKFLTSGQARRMDQLLQQLEADTGFRVYVLCQNYPNTPGLAIRDYWSLGKEVRELLVKL